MIKFSSRSVSYGFIGLGNMGRWMAFNIASKSDGVLCYDVDTQWKDRLKAEVEKNNLDVSVLDKMHHHTPDQLISKSDTLVTSLPSGQNSQDVANMILKNNSNKSFRWIDTTTASIEENKLFLKQLDGNCEYIDAPVSGGVVAARNGLLSFLVGCKDKQAYEDVQTVLNMMAGKTFHVGDNGAGLVAKLCNNLLLSIHMIGTCEALSLGKNLGVDPKILTDVMSASTGRSWSVDTYNPVPNVLGDHLPAANNYSFGFMNKLMNKDLKLALDAAESSKSKIQLGLHTKAIYQSKVDKNEGDLDFGSVWTDYDN